MRSDENKMGISARGTWSAKEANGIIEKELKVCELFKLINAGGKELISFGSSEDVI